MTSPTSVLEYYQHHRFNPVPIPLEDQRAWESHFQKRLNLYQRHLGIPLSLLRDRRVVEFGCNSGENALVLAAVGANLTLVEPNDQVWPRLRALFEKFHLEHRIVELVQDGIRDFNPEGQYDVVIAEGFLYTLPDRDQMLRKLASFLAPGGMAVMTINDRHGGLLEMTRQMLLRRACQLSGVDDIHSEASLDLARRLFYEEFRKINVSRPFEAWWKDALVNSSVTSVTSLWSYAEILPVAEAAGFEFHASSPRWASLDHFNWYKNVPTPGERHARLLEGWAQVFPYFLTGVPFTGRDTLAAPEDVTQAVVELVAGLSAYTLSGSGDPADFFTYPPVLDRYLASLGDPILTEFNEELQQLYRAACSGSADNLIHVYSNSNLRNLWGTPCHYICFTKGLSPTAHENGTL